MSCVLWLLPSVCPACAGMIRRNDNEKSQQNSLPRMRGDDPVGVLAVVPVGAFAPHARG